MNVLFMFVAMEAVGHFLQVHSFIEADGLKLMQDASCSGEMMQNYKYLGDFICHLSSYKCYQRLLKIYWWHHVTILANFSKVAPFL